MKQIRILFITLMSMVAVGAAIAESTLILDIPNRENTTTMGAGCDTCEPVTTVNCINQQIGNEPRCKCKLDDQNETVVNAFNSGCNALWEDPNRF